MTGIPPIRKFRQVSAAVTVKTPVQPRKARWRGPLGGLVGPASGAFLPLRWCYNFGIVRRLLPVCILMIGTLLASARPGLAATNISGLWDAKIVANQLEIPFRFELDQKGN